MKIALWAPPGALAAAVARRLKEEGHTLQAVGTRSSRGGANGNWGSDGNAALMREALRGARLLLHVGRVDPEAPLPLRLNRCLVPLSYLLAAAAQAPSKIERLVLLSDAALYGEGAYTCPANGAVAPQWRPEEDLRARRWEHHCPICGEPLLPAPTAETHPAAPLSHSGMLSYAQERLAMLWALERGVPVVALRYFEIYGAETLGRPGSLVSRAIAGLPVEISEDGGQTRDYIHLDDVTRAVSLALRAPCAERLLVNVASGVQTSLLDFVTCLERALGRPIRVRTEANFHRYEARHLYAQTAELKRLGCPPPISLREGLKRFAESLSEARPKISQGRKP